jgi:hypothetical protein
MGKIYSCYNTLRLESQWSGTLLSHQIPFPCASCLISWWWRFMLSSSGMLHLFIVAWWRLTICFPINHYGIASLSHIFTCPLSPNGQQASSIWSSQYAYLELLVLLNLDGEYHFYYLMGYTKSLFWYNPMRWYLTPHSNATHIEHGLVYKA